MRYDTDIQTNGYFYTDANGREVLERKRDYRPSWTYTVYESVSGNYYPVASRIWIKDNKRQMTILTGINKKCFFFLSEVLNNIF
jgi:lysosomal alpha-mannosidase